MPLQNDMFANQFPSFPNMFDNPFPQPNMFNDFSNTFNQSPAPQPKSTGQERIIPIQVIKENHHETQVVRF